MHDIITANYRFKDAARLLEPLNKLGENNNNNLGEALVGFYSVHDLITLLSESRADKFNEAFIPVCSDLYQISWAVQN